MAVVVNQNRRFSVDDHVFDAWNERSAYLYGVMFSDGHITNNSLSSHPRHGMSITLSGKDHEWLGELKKLFKAEAKIRTYISHDKYPDRPFSSLHFASEQIHARLIELGLKQKWPDIDSENARHFVRGLFDGDGSSFIDSASKTLRMNYVGTHWLCENIAESLRASGRKFGKFGPYKKSNSTKVVSLQFAGQSMRSFGDFIYGSRTLECLTRKRLLWEKYGG